MASKNFSVYSPHLFHLCCLHSLFSCKHTQFEVALAPNPITTSATIGLSPTPQTPRRHRTSIVRIVALLCHNKTSQSSHKSSRRSHAVCNNLNFEEKKINQNKKWSVQTLYVKFYFDENVYYLDFQLAMNYTLYLIRELSTNKCRIIKLTY